MGETIRVRIRSWADFSKKAAQPVFFVGGFLFEALTLNRVDEFLAQLFMVVHMANVLSLIFVLSILEKPRFHNSFLYRKKRWLQFAIQFSYGSLFSKYVIFYFQSASVFKTIVFMSILVILLFANEFLEKKMTNVYLQIGFFFFCLYSYFTFSIPVFLKILNYFTFLAAGVVSLGLIALIIYGLHKIAVFRDSGHLRRTCAIPVVIFTIMNLFYILDWIPPVPISLKTGGIYHSVKRDNGKYLATYEKPKWYQVLQRSDKVFKYNDGDKAYCFTAIFAPTSLRHKIRHRWMYYDNERNRWVEASKVEYAILGGREDGYRGYSFVSRLFPAWWRVDVLVEGDRLLARIPFEVVEADGPLDMVTVEH